LSDTVTTTCQRCNVPLAVNPDRNEDARLLRLSRDKGVCANCAMTHFLTTMEPLATVIANKGTDILLNPAVQLQVTAVLEAGDSDATAEELDWRVIVDQWSL
jgi:hypothetical protein